MALRSTLVPKSQSGAALRPSARTGRVSGRRQSIDQPVASLFDGQSLPRPRPKSIAPRSKLVAAGRLVVVANRLPVNYAEGQAPAQWSRSTGGLVTAVESVMKLRSSVWVGWAGAAGRAIKPLKFDGIALRPVGLTAKEVEDFYHGMSNRTLWPLYHDAIRTPEFRRRWWHCYQEANRHFARAAISVAGRNDVIWVHDYHLQLVPRMIREARPKARIGFFMHIPFPPEELFAWLPWRTSIVRGLLGADVIGFQTAENAQNFSRLARRYAGAEGTDSELQSEGRRIRVGAFPISIDFDSFERLAAQRQVIELAESIRQRLDPDRTVILSVDRLDYTKGIEFRLHALEELFRQRRLSVQKCVFVQIAIPSREPLPDYAKIRTEIERTVGRINGQVSEPGRVAVHYFRRSVSREELVAYYLAADIMLVTPLRDGMNLVAKEYVACRRDHTGVLVLSEFAGAAKELRRALLINPRDIDGLASTLVQAVNLPAEDAKKRMAILRMKVRRHDVLHWAESFLDALSPPSAD
ncbi:MAG: trehalose-6-phosphate synthase [Phycisphaerales bacterium]|nr:trehalose-6-phosphate synthase [Phycisphaerales bacterium]MCI0676067.1 trehalose-6-phosphate synthase [Phycisphaerales bacterium]